jgi:hypothetical protein
LEVADTGEDFSTSRPRTVSRDWMKSRLRVVGRMRDDAEIYMGGLLILSSMVLVGATAVGALPWRGALA